MAQRTRQSRLETNADIRADYALIAAAIGAALFALVYLMLG